MFRWKVFVQKRLTQLGASVLLGVLIGLLVAHDSGAGPQMYRGAVVRESSVVYPYISPLLACDIGSEDAFPEFAPLKQALTSVIATAKQSGDVLTSSVYLRSLKGARWLEINDAETYAPASLLKIFVLMAYFKEANETDNPALLEKQIPFMSSAFANDGSDKVGGTIKHLVDGQHYSIDDLITQMIVYSDNDAYATLLNSFDAGTLQALKNVSTDLSVPLPVDHSEQTLDFMPVDKYARIFQVLYGSTYLSERYSQRALALLTRATFTTGIVAGVPASVPVAHKYGIRAVLTPSSDSPDELHDCGIIYYPSHPYLLCVMTKGTDLVREQSFIQTLSRAAYTWLDRFYTTVDTSSSTPPN